MTTHYETLGIPREASTERVKRSYRSLVKIYHPDKFPSGSAEQAEAEKRIRDINGAYSVLSKPANRAKYDAKLSKRLLLYWGAEPEHCARCGKPTGYWDTIKRGRGVPPARPNNLVTSLSRRLVWARWRSSGHTLHAPRGIRREFMSRRDNAPGSWRTPRSSRRHSGKGRKWRRCLPN